LYLLEDDVDVVSLEEVAAKHVRSQGLDPLCVMVENRLSIEQAVLSGNQSAQQIVQALTQKAARLAEAYPDTLLKDCVSACHRTAESLYTFQRAFASQLGVANALQVALHMEPADAATLLFNRRTGQVPMYEVKTNVPQSGMLENPAEQPGKVPMRLTRNLKTLLSPVLIEGNLAVAMGATFNAIAENTDVVQPAATLFLREYLTLITTPGSDPRQLLMLANQNGKRVIELAQHLSPDEEHKRALGSFLSQSSDQAVVGATDTPTPIDAKIYQLLEAAMDADHRQSSMPLPWMSWM
jgi:hypothetical protein